MAKVQGLALPKMKNLRNSDIFLRFVNTVVASVPKVHFCCLHYYCMTKGGRGGGGQILKG